MSTPSLMSFFFVGKEEGEEWGTFSFSLVFCNLNILFGQFITRLSESVFNSRKSWIQFFSHSLCKICQNTGFLSPVFSRIRITEKPYSGVINAVNTLQCFKLCHESLSFLLCWGWNKWLKNIALAYLEQLIRVWVLWGISDLVGPVLQLQ